MSTPLGSKRSVSKCNPILTSVRVWCENVSGVCPGGIGETGGKSSEQTIESEIPIRLHVKCSAYCFPPEGYRKSVKSRIFGLIFYLLLQQQTTNTRIGE